MKRCLLILVVFGGLLVVASGVQASLALFPVSQNDLVTLEAYNGSSPPSFGGLNAFGLGGGGEFVWQDNTVANNTPGGVKGNPDAVFLTFCVQLYVNVSPGSQYKVGNISPNITSGPTDQHTVDNFAKWLAYEVYTGAINVDNNQLGGEVQAAIWLHEGYTESQVEGEIGPYPTTGYTWGNNSDINGWLTTYSSYVSSNPSDPVYNLVQVAQLTTTGADQDQNQLVFAIAAGPDTGGAIPEPTTIGIWGVGAAGRRRSPASPQAEVLDRGEPPSDLPDCGGEEVETSLAQFQPSLCGCMPELHQFTSRSRRRLVFCWSSTFQQQNNKVARDFCLQRGSFVP